MEGKGSGSARLAALATAAIVFGLLTSACSNGAGPAAGASPSPTPSPSPSLPYVVARISADTARQAFNRYLTDRISHIYNSAFPGGSWRFHSFGPTTADSATFVLTVRFTLGSPSKKVRSWATYSVTRDPGGQAWAVARISPPAQRVLPSPMWTVGP